MSAGAAGSADSLGEETGRGTDAETVGVGGPVEEHERVDPIGSSLGRYLVLEELGRGAMGRVVRAYDATLQREVALKQLRRAAFDQESVQRMVDEARAMAKLSHPNVVGIYDVEEVADDRVVLVMEYVPGRSLDRWLAERERSTTEIITAFVGAGRGLAAAHAAGLLHRDFKPANVLVADDAGAGRIKVADFGLAQSAREGGSPLGLSRTGEETSSEGTEHALVMGTPRYMAPEQHAALPLTTAADQYSYCVALWEALCGEPPFTGSKLGEDKFAGPPDWPNSATDARVVRAVRRGLSPEPSKRWSSLDELVAELERRSLRRRWILVGTGVFATAAGMGAWAAQSGQRLCEGGTDRLAGAWDEARKQSVDAAIRSVDAPYAPDVADRVALDLDAYADGWVSMYTDVCRATAIDGTQSERMMDLRMACLTRSRRELSAVTDVLSEADDQVVVRAAELVGALPTLSRCADFDALQAEVEPPAPAEAPTVERIRDLVAEARTQQRAGRPDAARESLTEARELLAGVRYEPIHTDVALRWGRAQVEAGEYEEAAATFRDVIRRAARSRRSEPMRLAATELMITVGSRLARPDVALRYLDIALPLADGDPLAEAHVRNNWATIRTALGEYPEATALHQRALELRVAELGPDHMVVASSRKNLAGSLYREGKGGRAQQELERVLEVEREVLGDHHPRLGDTLDALAAALYAQGKYEDAVARAQEGLAIREAVLGPDHPVVAGSLNNVAIMLTAVGEYEKAVELMRRSVQIRTERMGPRHPDTATGHDNLGGMLDKLGRYEEAEAEHRLALEARLEALGPDHPNVATARNNLATSLRILGRLDEAEREHREALRIWEQVFGPNHIRVATSHLNLSIVLRQAGRIDEALAEAEIGWARVQDEKMPPDVRGDAGVALAQVLWLAADSAKQRQRARDIASIAHREYLKAGEGYASRADIAKRFLAEHP